MPVRENKDPLGGVHNDEQRHAALSAYSRAFKLGRHPLHFRKERIISFARFRREAAEVAEGLKDATRARTYSVMVII